MQYCELHRHDVPRGSDSRRLEKEKVEQQPGQPDVKSQMLVHRYGCLGYEISSVIFAPVRYKKSVKWKPSSLAIFLWTSHYERLTDGQYLLNPQA